MGQYIRIDNKWENVVAVYKKINGSWVKLDQYDFENNIYIYDQTVIDNDVFLIIAESSYTGKQFYLIANLNGQRVYPSNWLITSGNNYATINSNGKVTILTGASDQPIVVQTSYKGLNASSNITVSYDNQLTIECADTMTGTSGNAIALYNSGVVNPTWSITSGNEYATIDSSGAITISNSGVITVSASYNNYTATKSITLVYNANQSSQTNVDPSTGAITNTETITTTDPETGAVTETSTSTTTNADGSTAETSSSTVTNLDGSSTTTSNTTYSDGATATTSYSTSSPDSDGSVTTIENSVINNADGTSSTTESIIVENEDGSSTTQKSAYTYDENGDMSSSSEIEISVSAPDNVGAVTTETTVAITNTDGTSSESSSTLIENTDGSSQSVSETIRYDENGDTTGSTTNTTDVNADGSSSSQTTNYDENGDPTDRENVDIDTTNNVNTQNIEYDSNGDPVVTGYTIDTTNNATTGAESLHAGDGIDTEFIPFDGTNGFELIIKFRTVQTEQPNPPTVEDTEDTGTNYHFNILGGKAAAKVGSVWPGIDIRWTLSRTNYSSGNLLARYQPGSGNQISSTITTKYNNSTDRIYYIKFVYNPNAATKMKIIDMWTNNVLVSSSNALGAQDLKITLGYALGIEGQSYRYSNVDIYEFSVTKL